MKLKVWWNRFWSNPYKWGLWHWIGERPWTYIIRDFAHANPFVMFLLGFLFALMVQPYLSWGHLLAGCLGFLAAHLFWGTKYRKGQQGK